MIRLSPGASVESAKEALTTAAREAGNVIGAGGSGIDQFNGYLEWAVTQERRLANAYGSAAIDELLRTQRYWAIQTMSPADYGAALGRFIELELTDRIKRFEDEGKKLDEAGALWQDYPNGARLNAAVLDTNVLMGHATSLKSLDWSRMIDRRPHEPIGLATLSVVLDELDSLKTAPGTMTNVAGESYPRRSLAQRALNELNGTFPDGYRRTQLENTPPHEGPIVPKLFQVLVLDDLDHTRLPTADAEILDRALSLEPFTQSVTVVSYDTNLCFTARSLGLRAKLLNYDETL
ncbi:PIN domain-containing protein [Streptomyces bacillaris]|uniref:PIN domain-containing protein n=1 Tax=Streptomyces bacillaris TaxID=68179 RepID=UPI0036DCD4EA